MRRITASPAGWGIRVWRSASYYGFPEITRAGAAVELAAKASDPDEIRNQILALASYLDRVEIVV